MKYLCFGAQGLFLSGKGIIKCAKRICEFGRPLKVAVVLSCSPEFQKSIHHSRRTNKEGVKLHLLRSGPYTDKASAEAAEKKVRNMGLSPRLVEVGAP